MSRFGFTDADPYADDAELLVGRCADCGVAYVLRPVDADTPVCDACGVERERWALAHEAVPVQSVTSAVVLPRETRSGEQE